ncbi:protein PHTF2 [Caerostris extrusa]|uniref:Protein PHTF2 n=1 Tax=Caerostris extrusa TaxID=172846 RepID=A0AAV4S7S8_CAEEX|nr:protein PHTF2 [Caerostris extrusa]
MSSLTSALNWYHKKIGAYDKELWEKSVDQRILRGVCAIPKELLESKQNLLMLILFDWIAATISGIKRVFLLPFFYSWWKLQTNALVSCLLVILYFLQILATYLYFSAEEKEFPVVPVSEIVTPIAMTFILGIVHSQIVATFTTTKSRKHALYIGNMMTRGVESNASEQKKKSVNYDCESKSSPDSASDGRHEVLDVSHLRQTVKESCDKTGFNPVLIIALSANLVVVEDFIKSGQHLRFSFDDNTKVVSPTGESVGVDSDFVQPPEDCIEIDDFKDSKSCLLKCSPLPTNFKTNFQTSNPQMDHCCHKSSNSTTSDSIENNFSTERSTKCSQPNISSVYPESSSNGQSAITSSFKDSFSQESVERDDGNFSSEEEFFVARKSSFPREQLANCVVDVKNTCNVSKLCSEKQSLKPLASVSARRFSDGGLPKKPKAFKNGKISSTVHCVKKDNQKVSATDVSSLRLRNRRNDWQEKRSHSMKLPINIKNFSSSCDSCTETSPTTPSKPQTSDLEWPLITNTDCNSDSTDCSTQCSEGNGSELSPSENPFAWEIQEPSKKLSNIGHTGSDKGYRRKAVSCTIWEHNECKKADLTALDISSAIIQK